MEPLNLTKIDVGDSIHLTNLSSRRKAAKKKLASTPIKGLTSEHVDKFLKGRFQRLYKRVKISGALTNDRISEYLSMFTSAAIPVLGDITRTNQESVIKNFAISTKNIVDKISEEGYLEPKRVIGVKLGIVRKSKSLFNQDKEKRVEIVEDIGVDLTNVSEEAQNNAETVKSEMILKEQIVPIGFTKNSDKMSVEEFFQLPLGEKTQVEESETPFAEHLLYLEKAVENKLFSVNNYKQIVELAPNIKSGKFKKYFQIFRNGELQEPTFMAVISLWHNNALYNLRT